MAENNVFKLPKMALSIVDHAILHQKNPWMPMWWSAALPGLGQLCQGSYLRGFILIFWEILINFQAKLNLAIMYTFTGQFETAKQTLNTEWALVYGAVFFFSIYDSYRTGVELGVMARIEQKQPRHEYQIVSMSALGVNYLSKGKPWVAVVWSALFSGFGHIYNKKIVKALIILGWAVAIITLSHINDAVIATFNGDFKRAQSIVDYQWLLFFPSIYFFAIWDAYNDTVEMNKVFAQAQKQHFRQIYGQSLIDGKGGTTGAS